MSWRSMRTAIGLICLELGCIGTLAAQIEQHPIVKIRNGSLEGTHFGSDPHAVAFLGIPFAAPPIGELRWKPPQPARTWNGTRKANSFGSPCPQLPAQWFPYIEGNEDCLYLNIWITDVRADANRAVLVYFHGGSNTQGYSQKAPPGPPLSQMGLVVVSANYRLGPFGFLAHPALTAESEHHSSGNYGLLDQLQALRRIKENVREFGGDPDRVTVMGQSAGALDICLLMGSPLPKGCSRAPSLRVESVKTHSTKISAHQSLITSSIPSARHQETGSRMTLVCPTVPTPCQGCVKFPRVRS